MHFRRSDRRGAALLFAALLSCAHARQPLAERVARRGVVVEVEEAEPIVRILCTDVEARAGARPRLGKRRVLDAFLGQPTTIVLTLPMLVVWNLASDVDTIFARQRAASAWLARRGEADLDAPEAALREVVRGAWAAPDLRAALVEGAVAAAREYGQAVVPGGAEERDLDGDSRIRLRPERVLLVFNEGEVDLRLGALYRAELIAGGSPVRRTSVWVSDPGPRPLEAWLGQGGSPLREALSALARRAGGEAAFDLVASLDDVPRQPPPDLRSIRGLAPDPTGKAGAPLELTRAESWTEPRRAFRVVPVMVDAAAPVLAWEEWRPRDAVPAAMTVRYDFRLWAATPRDAEDTPLFVASDLEAPRQGLAGVVQPGETYRWAVRAVASSGTRRLATRWSCAWTTPDDTVETAVCEPYRVEVTATPTTGERASTVSR